nr:hypothetical protein [Ectothiorhodospira shaposhnikovii]
MTLTLAAISAALSQPVATLRTTGRSREYRINFRATLLKFRDRFFSLWSADNSEKSILDLFQWIIQDQEMIRPGRSNPRKSKYINPLPGVVA